MTRGYIKAGARRESYISRALQNMYPSPERAAVIHGGCWYCHINFAHTVHVCNHVAGYVDLGLGWCVRGCSWWSLCFNSLFIFFLFLTFCMWDPAFFSSSLCLFTDSIYLFSSKFYLHFFIVQFLVCILFILFSLLLYYHSIPYVVLLIQDAIFIFNNLFHSSLFLVQLKSYLFPLKTNS